MEALQEVYFGPGGWVKVHRKIISWRWSSSSNHMALFMQILLRANYKATTWRKETILPGQLLTGSKQLSDWTGLSRMQVRRALKDLEDSGEITSKTTNKYSIITITNWDSYQITDQQATNKEPTSDQQVTTSKNANNTKKVKKDKNILLSSPLSFLFSQDDEIQSWLLTGTEASQKELLEKYSHHVLAEEVKKAFIWQLENKKRNAGMFLITWMGNKKTSAFGVNQAQKSFSPQTTTTLSQAELKEARELGII